jgi:hypothetical protein
LHGFLFLGDASQGIAGVGGGEHVAAVALGGVTGQLAEAAVGRATALPLPDI